MKRFTHLFLNSILILTLGLTSLAYSFDRQAEHARQVTGCNPDLRKFTDDRNQERTLFSQSLPDYVISQAVTPARFTQQNADVVELKSGQWLTVWSDNRDGANKIFAQKLTSAGVKVGANQLVVGSTDGSHLIDPTIKVDTAGHLFLFYRDVTRGLIFGTRLDENLNVTVPEFLVNDTTSVSYAGLYDVAVYPDGRFVAVWENSTISSIAIQMRIFDVSGTSVLGPVDVSVDGGSTIKWEPNIAVEPNSGFLITWEDDRTGNSDIYARLYNGAGTALGADFDIIPPGSASFMQSAPRVAFSPRDKYILGWIDRRAGLGAYIQRYDATTGLVGVNERISPVDTSIYCWDLNFSVNSAGDLRAVWETRPLSTITMLAFTTGFMPNGGFNTVNESSVGGRFEAAIAHAASGNYSVAWREVGNDEPDIHYMLFSPPFISVLANESKVNDDVRGAPVADPVIEATTTWTNLVAFSSSRRDEGDIILGNINNSGIIQRANVQVNQDAAGSLQFQPGLAVSPNKVLTVWVDGRDVLSVPGQRIYGRFSDAQGGFLDNEFMISDSDEVSGSKTEPKAAMNSTDKGLVIWLDTRFGFNPQVMGRWLTTGGALDGAEINVSSLSADTSCAFPTLATDTSGRFYAIWLDNGVDSPVVRGHWFNANGSEGGTFSWKPTDPGTKILELAADVTPDGNIAILWTAIVPSGTSLYLSVLSNTGTQIVSPREVPDAVDVFPTSPSVSVSVVSQYISCTWVDRRNGNEEVFFQIYDGFVLSVGPNEAIASSSLDYMRTPATDNNFGRAWFVWVDPRQYGDNVWGAFTIYQPTDADGDDKPKLPSKFLLGQNYPNPFNPKTEIPFSLTAKTQVSLVVFNVLGQQVRTVLDEVLPAGEHTAVWDGRDNDGNSVTTGVYFYRLQAGSIDQVKKMVLLK